MTSSADSQSRNSKFRSWRSSLTGVLLAGAFIYVWILPLFQPRGDYIWGHFRLRDIYFGIPIGLAVLCTVLILAVPARHRRPFAARLVTVVIAVVSTLAASDAVYALLFMGALRSNYWLDQVHISRRHSAADAELGFVRKPFVSWRGYVSDVDRIVEYRTVKNGFRNSTETQRADIVFIGDSFTESATIVEENTFVQRVAHSTGLSTVNLGRGAYGPQQELIVLKRYGLPYQPRFVVWQLFEGNDLTDAEAFAKWKQSSQQVNTSLKRRYLDNSLLRHLLSNTRLQKRSGPMASLRYSDGTSRRITLRYPYEPDQPTRMHLGMTETVQAIEAGHQLCESRGIQLLVLFIPTMVRVMAPEITFDRVEDQKRYAPELQDRRKDFSGRINELCTRIGCNSVDSFEALRAALKNNQNLYILNDEHLDVGGHEVMTQIVERWVQSKDVAE